MQICLDYQPAVAQCAGIGRYTRVLAAELPKILMPEDSLQLFFLNFKGKAVAPVAGASMKSCRVLPGCALQRSWRYLGWPPFNVLSGNADVFHFTNFVRPPLSRGKSVTTVFDMSFERFPQFAEERNLSHLRAGMKRTAEESDAIITISEFSGREIEELLPAAAGKTRAVPLGISPDFKRSSEQDIAKVKTALKLDRPYILTVGTVEPRKNLQFFADVFRKLDNADLDWVVAGMPGWKCDPIFSCFRDSPAASRIRYVQYVPDGMLSALYSGAVLFALPSVYEGFGFPPLEAMACGTPVVSSNGGSLPEVLGNGAEIIGSFNADEWCRSIMKVLSDSELRARLTAKGIARAAEFRWEKTAAGTLEVYKEVLGR